MGDFMKKSDVFIGTVKQCNNIYWYERRGEKYFDGDFTIGRTTFGRMRSYVDEISDKAILIKVSEDKYIWFDLVNTIKDRILVDFGIAVNVIGTKPHYDNEYFVDESTLEPYFKENINENINVKTLKKELNDSK